MTALAEHVTPQQADRTVSEREFLTRVEQRLETFLGDRCRVLRDVGPDLEPIARTVHDLARGGKRLRASFCYWGWRGAGADDLDAAVDAAASLELFHLGALVHDDLMDHSATRRGLPTAHESFADVHRTDGFDGDATDFGSNAALLVGDLCLTWSDELLDGCDAEPSRHAAARRVFHLMRSQVMAGQYLDMLEQARPGTTPAASTAVLHFKSAKYTVEHPLLLGGALAGASDALSAAYSEFGLPIGEAFQLRDDVLGVFGDPAVTGKPVGDDLREGKKTVLVLVATERADDRQRRLLADGLGDRGLAEQGVRDLQTVLTDTGALDEVERRITDLTARGTAAIRSSEVPGPVADGLTDLAVRIAGRAA